MERAAILFLIAPFIALSLYIFQRRKYFTFSAFELFIFFFTIYLVLIPIDHVFGLHIREHQSFLSLNFDENNVEPSNRVLSVIVLYIFFFSSVLFGYLTFLRLKNKENVLKKPATKIYQNFYIPSIKVLLIFNVNK